MILKLLSWVVESFELLVFKSKSKQKKLDMKFMEICFSFSKLSKCVSHQVACIIVKNNRIISSGVNGTPPGFINCDKVFNKKKFDRKKHHQFSDEYEVHAEQNAVAHAAKYGIAINGSTAYCTLEPCIHCCKILSMTGVRRIVYNNKYDMFSKEYRSKRNKYLKKIGIKLQQTMLF